MDVKTIGKATYEIDKVVQNWRLSGETLASALVDMAEHDIEIPDEALGYWMGEVDHDGLNFIVTLYYDADQARGL